jgi:NADPH:quinone reductase-like Zn-dependent oxidoreductase
MAPSTMKQWAVTSTDQGFDGLKFEDAPVPKVGDNDVLVKLHAASLNYRDLIIPLVRHPLHVLIVGDAGATASYLGREC